MKRFVILFAILCCNIATYAQIGLGGGATTVGRISGTVIDSANKQTIDYATVSLFRNTGKSPVTGVVTDEKGNFKLDNVKPGVYRLEISFIGYGTKVISGVETTPSKPDKALGNVGLSSTAKALKEVNITGTKGMIENRIDKIVYNAEKDLTAVGGNATDMLQKVPLVSVDMNGNVSLRGDANVRVLINGRPSGATSSSLADVLKGIPASQIKNIEVITSPSAKYDAEGSGGIINIITKSKNVSGFSGGINGAVGTRQNNGSANIAYNKNRFNLSADIGGNASWPQTSLTEREQIFTASNARTLTVGSSEVKRHSIIGSVAAGYEFNAYNSLNSTIRVTDIAFKTSGTSTATGANNFVTNSMGDNKPASGFDWNLDYVHKFKKEGHELDLSTQWSHTKGLTNYTTLYSALYQNIKNNIKGVSNEYTVQADYTLPINKVFKLEAGGKTILRRIESDNEVFSPLGGDFAFNSKLSNSYNYDQDVVAGYSVLTINLPKQYSILAGIRDENTSIKGNPLNSSQNVLPFSQNYNTFIPSLTLQKVLSPTKTLKLAYSKRITRPSLQFLNPFVNQSNILAQSTGNPKLSPEVSQTLELGYNAYIGTNILNASVYYKRTSNLIEGVAIRIPVEDNGQTKDGTLTTYQNIGTNNSIGTNVFGTVTPIKMLTILGNINAFTYTPRANGDFITQQSQTGTYIMYTGLLRATITLPKDYLVEIFALGTSPRRNIQGNQPGFSIFGLGARKQFMQKKMSIGINALEPFANYKNFNSSTTTPSFSQTDKIKYPFRSFGLTFSYNFGKLSFSTSQKKNGVNNDDLKTGGDGGGGVDMNVGGASGGQGGQGGRGRQ